MPESEIRAFYIEEYRQLKIEVAGLLSRIELLARYSMLVSALVFSWLANQSVAPGAAQRWCMKLPGLAAYAWYIPFVFSILAMLAAFSAYWRGRELGHYLEMLEKKLTNGGSGWEVYLKTKPPVLTITGSLFWLVLIISTFVVASLAVDFVSGIQVICEPG